MNLLRRRDGGSELPRQAAAPPPDDGLKASAMRGSEPLYGYVVALELVVVGVLNLTVTSGKGAPSHPSTALAGVGVAAAISLFGFLQTKNRVLVAFAVIAAAFLIDLPKVPNSLALAHVFSLALPFAYSLILTQRHRKRMKGELLAARARRSAAPPRSQAGRKAKDAAAAPRGPRPSGRYTPPKAQRPKKR